MPQPSFPAGRIKAVFFDVQGTLVDREAAWRDAFAEALGEFAGRWDGEGFSAEEASEAADRYRRALRAVGRSGGSGRTGPGRRGRLAAMKIALAATPVPVTPSFLASLYRRTRSLVPHHPAPAPGARDALARLARRYRLGIISNASRPRVAALLAGAGLDGFFPAGSVFVPSRRGRGKPGRQLFRAALAAFAVRPGQAVMVGDSWRKDVLGAVRCGMHAVHLAPGNKKTGRWRRRKPAVARVARFKDLVRLLEA